MGKENLLSARSCESRQNEDYALSGMFPYFFCNLSAIFLICIFITGGFKVLMFLLSTSEYHQNQDLYYDYIKHEWYLHVHIYYPVRCSYVERIAR